MNTPYNNRDNGFDKAQRAYDRMEPDETELSEDEEQSRREAYEDYLERKAEEAREEQLLELPYRKLPDYPHDGKYSGLGECKENE